MKITTWNVNGIRSLKRSVPYTLQDFCSDIVCFQETKVSRGQLPEETALVDGYTSYFTYPKKSGYSGVATYCRNQFTPENAEEELTIGDAYIESFEGSNCNGKIDFEGRVMITHHLIKAGEDIQRLVVINVYCPRVDPEKPERHLYKIQFCHLLQAKMMELCMQGCSVVIVGDLNIACSVIDHCDPGDEKEFNSSEARQWMKSFFSTEIEINGSTIKAVDAFRYFYPDRTEAYTCWNTKTGARSTNYGTRIDYIILSSDLIPLLSSCEILSDYHGSDHCPVVAQLRCDPLPELKVQLPAICTRLWPEFTGQQQKLNSFFKKVQNSADSVMNQNKDLHASSKSKFGVKKNKQKAITSFFKSNSASVPYTRPVNGIKSSGDKYVSATNDIKSYGGEYPSATNNNQSSADECSSATNNIKSYFEEYTSSASNIKSFCGKDTLATKDVEYFSDSNSSATNGIECSGDNDESLTNDIKFSCDKDALTKNETHKVEQNDSAKNQDVFQNSRTSENKSEGWKALFRGPPKPPLCTKHQKPCVLRTVKKNGPNVGRQFYMCSQPAGAPSNPDANCNFFKWVTAPKINSLKLS